MRPGSESADAGYLLIEALVALAIIAAMAAMVFETVWQAGETRLRVGQKREAILLARSVLAAAAAGAAPSPIAAQGVDGGLAWAITREAWASGDGNSPLQLERVTVAIRAQRQNAVLAHLSTLRSAP